MKLVSTTLTANADADIGDALASVVAVVDACLVVDTGATDGTLDVARAVAGDKLMVRTFPWSEDFSAARNFALEASAELGASWCITVDTDERIDWRGEDLRATVRARDDVGCWMMQDAAGTYAKERAFRLPTPARFAGPTHESFPAHVVGVVAFPPGRPSLVLPSRRRAPGTRESRGGHRRLSPMRGPPRVERGERVVSLSRGGVLVQAAAMGRRGRLLLHRSRAARGRGRARVARRFRELEEG